MKRFLAAITTAVLATGAVAAGPDRAAAVPTCTIDFPGTLVVTAPSSQFEIPLADDCTEAHVVHAEWSLTYVRTGESFVLTYDDADGDLGMPDTLAWSDTKPLGAFDIDPLGATTGSVGEPVTQNSTTTAIKAASKASQVVTRNGSNATVKAGASYYSARQHKQVPWFAAAVEIQTSNALDGRWTTIATVTTGVDGTAAKAFKAPSARYWRVLTPTTASVFGRYSVPVFR